MSATEQAHDRAQQARPSERQGSRRRVAALAAVGMAVPDRLVTNAQIAELLGVQPEWIAKRTGTAQRPWARDGERLSDFAARAGRAALQQARVSGAELDLVLVATSSADEITPNAAPLVAELVGARGVGAFDVGAACTGWLGALAMACGQIESGRVHNALVVGADFLSRFLDPADRDTLALFADGAGAAVLSAGEPGQAGEVGPIALHSDGAGAQLIRLERGGQIRMQGPETFRAAVRSLCEVTLEAVALAGRSLDEIDVFAYHQANSRIIRAVGQRLGLRSDRVLDYVSRFANSSTATLPIALAVAEQEGRLRPGDLVLLAAFGGGFTWGGTVVRWPAVAPQP